MIQSSTPRITVFIQFNKAYSDIPQVMELLEDIKREPGAEVCEAGPQGLPNSWLVFSFLYSDASAKLANQLIQLTSVLDFEIGQGDCSDFVQTLKPLADSGEVTGDFGSATDKDWRENIPKLDDLKPDFQWNHTLIRFPEALQHASAPDPTRNYPGLDLAKVGSEATDTIVVQFDTGWTGHTKLANSGCYHTDKAACFINSINGIGSKKEAKDKLDKYGFPAPQKPGHGTATAHTVIGGKATAGLKDRPDENAISGIFTDDLAGGLFPYITFIPYRVANRVVLNLNPERSSEDVLKAVEWAISNDKPHVITMSMGGELWGVQALKSAAQLAYKHGIIFVCAAGNSNFVDNLFGVVEPAAQKETIAVAGIEPRALQQSGEIRYYPWQEGCDGEEVDISAPSKYIYTAYIDKNHLDGCYKFGGATSQATAHVAAAAALWRHYYAHELSQGAFALSPSLIVEAFRWGLKASANVPFYWQNPNEDPSVNDKLRNAIRNNKGILDVRNLLSPEFSPLKYLETIGLNPAPSPVAMTSRSLTQSRILKHPNPQGRVLNCVNSASTDQDWDFTTALGGEGELRVSNAASIPPEKDLRDGADWWKINDQGSTGSCVGWAAADSVLRWHLVKMHLIDPNRIPSVRFVWMAAKEMDEFTSRPSTFIESAGTSLKAALDILRKYGCVMSEVLPFGSGTSFTGDEKIFYSEASRLKIGSYYNLTKLSPVYGPQARINVFKRWLATRGPVLTRLNVDSSFMSANADNYRLDEYTNVTYGGHAVAIVGYTSDNYFIIRNSWGPEWGNQGYAYASAFYTLAAFDEAYGIVLQGEPEVSDLTQL
ncbi:MAG: S8 family serine peptidase [Bacteroidia bacterium]|nr:S8 family serine peptidase [Bacteroidia bacterium]